MGGDRGDEGLVDEAFDLAVDLDAMMVVVWTKDRGLLPTSVLTVLTLLYDGRRCCRRSSRVGNGHALRV